MSVQPVVYNEENTIPHVPGRELPDGNWLMIYEDGSIGRTQDMTLGWDRRSVCVRYAPLPILKIQPEPKEIPFGEAMERIRNGEEFLWELDDRREVVGQDRRVLCFMRSPSSYPINNFGELGDGRFYEIPWPSTPEPKTTGLKWWEAIEAVRGTDKWARHKNAPMDSSKRLYARWDGNVLRDARGELFHFNYGDVTAEWEIVE